MNPLLIKGLMAVGSIGVGGVGGVGIWQINEHMKPRTIQERLGREGVSFPSLDNESDLTSWKTLFDSNNALTNGDKVSLEGETGSGDNADAQKMRSACGKLMGKSLSDTNEQEIKKVKDRCAKQAN